MQTYLPPGWITQLDPNGRTFFVHTPTGQTQWEFPAGNNVTIVNTPQEGLYPVAPGRLANDPLSRAMGMNQMQYGGSGGWAPTPNVECNIPGLEKLVVVQDLFVKEDIRQWPVPQECCCWSSKRYKVLNEQGNRVYNAVEESDTCCRWCCAPHHALKVAFTDEYGKQVALLDRPFRCNGCCPACFSCCRFRATVAMGDDQKIRSFIYQPTGGGGFKPTYNFYTGEDINIEMGDEAIARLQETAVVEGPWCCFGGFFESNFVVRSPGEDPLQSQVYGNITRVGTKDLKNAAREFLTDDCNNKIDFDTAADPQMRATMMANMVLLDFMFFENEGLFDCGFEDGGVFCSVHPCDCYCYGCLCPCVIKCNSNSGGGD